ncbi:MAG: membrane protein [Pirellulaceae bacterium]|nr:MAG: membrane protein [Pirellulaceae bacterium]
MMIVERPTSWLKLLFTLHGSTMEFTWRRLVAATLFATLVTFLQERFDLEEYTLTMAPFTVIGIALSIFLGFRNNAAYDRFWEGRKLWGSLVNTSRSIARMSFSLLHADTDDPPHDLTKFREGFVRRTISFVHALRCHLRDERPDDEVLRYLSVSEQEAIRETGHVPVRILQMLAEDLSYARQRGWIHELNLPALEGQLVELTNILGGCERIKNTPIPFSYTVLLHRIAAFYCFTLPLGLVDTVGWGTPIVVAMVAHAFLGLDALGDEIENPFGYHANDLPLSSISRNIEINLLELLGEKELPPPWPPVDGELH